MNSRSVLPFLVPSSLLVAYLVRTRAPERWRRPLLVGTLAVTLTAAVAVGPGFTAPATVFIDTALVGDRARMGETELGDLIADALRAATGADIAFLAAGELKEVTLGPGNLSPAQIVGALNDPEDPVVVLPLPGTTIRQALEVAVSRYPVKQKGFLQVSGLSFAFDPSRDANRVVAVSIGGQPLQDGRTYRVAMSSPLAAGAHGYIRLWKRDQEVADKGMTLAGAVQNYLRDRDTLTLRAGSRITIRSQH